MNTQPNAVPETSLQSPAATISPIQSLNWSIRRELWENPSIYVAPLVAAVVFLFGFFISLFVVIVLYSSRIIVKIKAV